MSGTFRTPFISKFDIHSYRLLGLLILIALTMVLAMTQVLRGVDSKLLIPIAILAVILGKIISNPKIKIGWIFLVSLIFGLLVVGLIPGGLFGYLLKLSQKIIDLIKEVVLDSFFDIKELQVSFYVFREAVYVLFARIANWYKSYNGNSYPLYDPVVIMVIWGLIMWITCFWMGILVFRYKKALYGIIPVIGMTAGSLAFVNGPYFYNIFMLGCAIGLIVLENGRNRETYWEENGIGFSKIIQKNTFFAAGLLSIGIMFFSGILTALPIEKVIDYFKKDNLIIEEDNILASSLGLERKANNEKTDVLGDRRNGGLPTSHLVGTGSELSEEIVMLVDVDDPYFQEYVDGNDKFPIYYFRSLVYDEYNSKGWHTSKLNYETFGVGDGLNYISGGNGRVVQQNFRYLDQTQNLVHVTGFVTEVDEITKFGFRNLPVGVEELDVFGGVIGEDIYNINSFLPIFSEDELRSTGNEYPEWIRNRYLTVPTSVPDRVISLAIELTATQSSPYDKAKVLEQYLRQFPYTLDLPARPKDRDVADYFLYEVRKGYCDYYATTMVVMARSVGLPARLVIGYIGSTYDSDNGYYVVTADQAHSWVEIYFPDYGWIEFEPTGGRPEIDRIKDKREIVHLPNNLGIDPFEKESIINASKLVNGVVWVILFAVLINVNRPYLDALKLKYFAPEKTFSLLYTRMREIGELAGAPFDVKYSPYEYASIVVDLLNSYKQKPWLRKILSRSPEYFEWITNQIVLSLYSQNKPDDKVKAKAIKLYVKLRQRIWVTARLIKMRNMFSRLLPKKITNNR